MSGTSADAKYNMLNRLQAASGLLIRASLALFTCIVLLLIQSAFWSARVSTWMQAIVLATALLSYFRPQLGLLTLAVLVPLAQVGSRALDSQMRGAEALVLACLAGLLVRGWTPSAPLSGEIETTRGGPSEDSIGAAPPAPPSDAPPEMGGSVPMPPSPPLV